MSGQRDQEQRLWTELDAPDFDPERSDASPEVLAVVSWRELTRLLAGRIFIFVALVIVAVSAGFLSGSGMVALVGGALCGAMVLPLCRIYPSRRWTNAVMLALDLCSDLPPDRVARCLLELAEGDRFLRYRRTSYARTMLHRVLESALSQARYFVANERECRFLLLMARSRRYPIALRVAAIQALAPPGIALNEALRHHVELLARRKNEPLVYVAALDILRRA
ncbi:MAG: hypothetical protein QM758_03125 [Armatimonas sp.]